ncbi:bahd family acyltransferase [Moniliophthora roreri MCA 2997]|uniref:Bahd family acyltransferase n=2 Tax=Moniliophthora roreri TaxID=221103 RepID=V2XXA0_MONRO|nr:bahd family acyltransferase [Moniliophthora roreri MCA 2997]KAI3596788.1 bahd family acyltransferase [Moniliophthora roreri]
MGQETIKTFTIHPTNKFNRPAPPSTVSLHGLDLISAPMPIRNHRIFPPLPAHLKDNATDVIEKLKTSLAEALELYPPISGTVRANDAGDVYIAMDAENRQGTPFTFEEKDTPYAGDNEDLTPRDVMILSPLDSILAVKVTQFSCGTIAVAASINHQVTDLRGFVDFLEMWAQLARGEPVDFVRIPEDWSRHPGRFFGSSTAEKSTVPPPGYIVLPAPLTESPPFVAAGLSRWKFTKSDVERLKNDLSPSAFAKDTWISSGDALAALLWGVISRARVNANVTNTYIFGKPDSEGETQTLAMAADGRDRSVRGKMSDGKYLGNFNLLFTTIASSSDLLSLSLESASRVALAIRTALNHQLAPEAIAHKISFFEDPRNTKPPGRISWPTDVVMTNWSQADLRGPKLDLGWGKPICTTAGGGVYPPGYSRMMQDKSTGDVYVLITIEPEGSKVLESDELLNKYATSVTVAESPLS